MNIATDETININYNIKHINTLLKLIILFVINNICETKIVLEHVQ